MRQHRGQSLLEYAVMISAVTVAILLMTEYAQRAFNAQAKLVEVELNGAVEDNRPSPRN